MSDLPTLLSALLAGCSLLAFLYARRRGCTLTDLRGPKPASFWLGNEADIRYQNEVGDCEFKWMSEYGSAWRRASCFGIDHLMLADPKAIKHILHSAGYHYPKSVERAQILKLMSGNGLSTVQGQTHHRQRKIITPAFSTPRHGPDALDIIGEAGFDFQFGSLDNIKNPLKRNENMFVDTTLYPSWYDLLFKATWKYIPGPLLGYVRYLPMREYRGFRSWLDNVREFSRGLIKQTLIKGDGNDIMSVLLRANGASDPKNKMLDDELVDQVATFIAGGHDTSAKTLAWYFYAIAKHPEAQTRIREEIALVRARATGEEFSIADLNSMVYTLATLKESMRLDPISWMTARRASRDDILPLAFPITTKSGERITSIPIKKGTPIDISFAAYNRLPDVWGEDANEWNPERFLDPQRVSEFKEVSSNIGVFSNVISFSTGTRACIAWQFAVLEMQIIILTLLENFEFSLPPQNKNTKIHRKPGYIMLPMAEGEKGIWMGLLIKPVNCQPSLNLYHHHLPQWSSGALVEGVPLGGRNLS